MTRLLNNDERTAVRWLNFKKVGVVSAYRPFGPNTMGENLWPVEVSDKRIGFSYIGPVQ
jgi:hypothetical protein